MSSASSAFCHVEANRLNSVGVSGHFLHGGFGFSSHTHGLATDAIVSATVVLADGRIVEASKTKNADLLWGLKGAGSNFGIVASWKLATYEAPAQLTRFGIVLGWTKENGVAGLEAVEAYAKNIAPREINFRIGDYARGNPEIEGLFYGSPAQLEVAITPLLNTLPAGWTRKPNRVVNWIESVISYSNYDEVDWVLPSPVSRPFLDRKSTRLNSSHWE